MCAELIAPCPVFVSISSCRNCLPRSMLIHYGSKTWVESERPRYLWQCSLLSPAQSQFHTPDCSLYNVQGDSLFVSVFFALLDYEVRAQVENALWLLFSRVLRRELNPEDMTESIYWPYHD